MPGIETVTGTLHYGKKIKVMIAPKNLVTPVTLTDVQYFSNNSGLLLAPSADGTSCECQCDPAPGADPATMIGQTVEVTATGGGIFAKAILSVVAPVVVAHATATSLGISVSAEYD